MDNTTSLPIDAAVPPTPEPLPVDTGITEPVGLDPTLASNRAAKASYGLGDKVNKTYQEYFQDFVAGREGDVRQSAASALDSQRDMATQKAIAQIAGERKGPLSVSEVEHIKGLVKNWKPTDPNSVIEDAFSVKAVNKIYDMLGTPNKDDPEDRNYSWFEDAIKVNPFETDQVVETGKKYNAGIEYVRTLKENVDAEVKNQTTIGWLADQAKNLSQIYQEYKLRGNVPIDVWGGLGTSKEAQAIELLKMSINDPEGFKKKVTNITDYLRKDNPALAAEFLDSILGQSTLEKALGNAFTAIAIPDLALTGKGALSLARKAILHSETNIAMRNVTKSLQANIDEPIKVRTATAVGDLEEAAVQKTTANILANMSTETPQVQRAVKEAAEALPDIMKQHAQDVRANPGRSGQELANRIAQESSRFANTLLETIANVAKVQRINPALATEDAVRAIKEDITDRFTGIRNSILNITGVYPNPVTNTYHADVIIGQEGKFFLRKEAAQQFANVNGLSAYKIEQDGAGLGWYIAVPQPVNETTHAVRDFLLATKASQSPDSWLSAFAGWLRTPEETLALEQRMNRKVATYAPSELMKVARETATDIEKLAKLTLPGTKRKDRWNEWVRAVEYARDAVDPHFVGPLEPNKAPPKGYFFKSPAELEEFYQQTFKRLPEEQEVKAYFAFKRLGEMDHALRNLTIYRNMSRVGALNHAVAFVNEAGERTLSNFFPGVVRTKVPGGTDTILVVNATHGAEELYRGGAIPTVRRKELEEGVKKGEWKVVEVYDTDLRPFQSFSPKVTDQKVRWVLTKNLETKPLDYNNLPYKGGGHFEYDYQEYIKQAKVSRERVGDSIRHIYEGDNTFAPIGIRAMGEDVANKINEVRRLLANGDKVRAREYAAQHLDIEWKKLYGWFKPTKDPYGNLLAPRFSLREPFQVVSKNVRLIDKDKSLESRYAGRGKFEDGTRSGSLARQYTVQYTNERDAFDVFTMNNKGSVHNPYYTMGDAKMVDPIPTMNRALSRITNSFFMDDYKISAIEHWLQEAKPFLKATEDEIHYSPFYHFNDLSDTSWKPGALKENAKEIQQLKVRHYQIKQFSGTPSSTDALLHGVAQKLSDSIYAKFGEDGLKIPGTGIQLSPAWMLDRLTDPIKFVRSVTFHAKLGLFAIPQLMVQMQTFVTIMGVAGMSKAAPGALATMLHQWGSLNPRMIGVLDGYASKLSIPGMSRWKPGEFKEAYEELKRTGFSNVAGEYALRDDIYSSKVVGTGKDKFLDAGAYFFNKGEKTVRQGAYYTAYREFRDANPTLKITDTERRAILERATLLNVNMDRSSNSMLQHGVLSLPMQFLTYQVRAAELFTSKRLTGLERARLLGTYAMMYGVPGAVGATGIPLGDQIRKTAIDQGYVVGENWISSVMEGIPATLVALASGGGDPRKGNWYNFGERYGPGGFEVLSEALRGDKTIWDIMGGAAFSTLANTWTNSDGFRTAMMARLRGDPGFQATHEDMIDIFKEISSVNAAWRLWAAVNYGVWQSKKETHTANVSTSSAAFMTVMGLQPQGVSDLQIMKMVKTDEKEMQKYALNKFTQEFHRAVQIQNDDPKQAKVFFDRAFGWLDASGYPQEDRPKAVALASKDNGPLIDRMNWDFGLKDVPEQKKARRAEQLKKKFQMEGY